ncbi:MAG: hypothetical protein AAF512_13650 [Pseudomonadota bacterium]
MNHDYFELRRLSHTLVYQFDQKQRPDGTTAYCRRDMDLWIIRDEKHGWVAIDPASAEIAGRPWHVLPTEQANYPPAGEWVSKKGVKSYVYELVYRVLPSNAVD